MAGASQEWVEQVVRECDRVFAAADVGFLRQEMPESGDVGAVVRSVLWEADAELFDAKYPGAGMRASYGEQQWPPPCIDYWLYLDEWPENARISVEGWGFPEVVLRLHGHPGFDAMSISAVFAKVLEVPMPWTMEGWGS